MNNLYALNGKVIIKPAKEESRASGIIVQTSSESKIIRGVIHNISTHFWSDYRAEFVTLPRGETEGNYYIDIGDTVFYERYSALELKIEDEVFHIIDRKAISVVMKENKSE